MYIPGSKINRVVLHFTIWCQVPRELKRNRTSLNKKTSNVEPDHYLTVIGFRNHLHILTSTWLWLKESVQVWASNSHKSSAASQPGLSQLNRTPAQSRPDEDQGHTEKHRKSPTDQQLLHWNREEVNNIVKVWWKKTTSEHFQWM